MTQATPPGWYPDPGQKNDGPATERWWDGTAWTDRVRPSGPADDGAAPGAEPTRDGAAPDAGQAHDSATPDTGQAAGAGQAHDGASPGAAPGQPYPGQEHAGRPYPGQPYHGQPYPAQPYPAQPGYPVHPGYPGLPVQPPSARRRRLRNGIAVAVAVAVLAGIGVGVYALTDDGSGGDGAGASQPSQQDRRGPGDQDDPFGDSGGSGGGPGESPAPDAPQGSEPPTIDSGSVPDPVSGISLPIPDGWSGQQLSVGASVTSDDSYKCPGDTSSTCTRGGAYSAPAVVLKTEGDTAEEVAKADIQANAEESYGGKSYGKITSHQELASKAVTVAGQKGWLVRWKAVTSEGSDGYVESLALPSPSAPDRIVVIRFGVDVEEGQSVIDDITEGIKVDTSGGGGSGQDV